MARLGRLTALAALTLTAALLERAFAVEAGAPVAVAARLTQDGAPSSCSTFRGRSTRARPPWPRPSASSSTCRRSPSEVDPAVGRVGGLRDGSLVKDFRFGLFAARKSRIVIDLARSACPAGVSSRPIVDGAPAARLTIELKPCNPAAFAALVHSPAAAAASAPDAPVLTQPPVIVLDPGHGGIDGGAQRTRRSAGKDTGL